MLCPCSPTRIPISREGCGRSSRPSLSTGKRLSIVCLSVGSARLIATCVSFTLRLLYLSVFPFTAVGMAVLIGAGTAVLALLGRRGDIVTAGITTAVVMVVAAMSPEDAWHQPLLRLAGTVVGIAVGVAGQWAGSSLFSKLVGEQTR